MVDNIENLFEKLIYHYNEENIKFDAINICITYCLFYKEYDIENELTEEAIPLCDFATVCISMFNSFYNEQKHEEDPDELLEIHGHDYIVSLSEFKKQLYLRGFDIDELPSFEDLDEEIKSESGIVSRIKIDFSKPMKKVKSMK